MQVAGCVLVALVGASTVMAARPVATGTWQWNGPAESGMFLKTLQVGDKVRFQLEISRGAPSYNSGFVQGEFPLAGHRGTYATGEEGVECEITFTFHASSVELVQSAARGTCGFGGNVHADGVLSLKSRLAPTFSEGDPREGEP